MNNFTAEYYIEKLGLEPHYEGGWFKFIWKTDRSIPREILGDAYSGDRASASLIYFLLKSGEVSEWHKLLSAEMWFWHAGGTLKMTIGGSGEAPAQKEEILLGKDPNKGERFQAIIPAGHWQTSTPASKEGFVLVSCVVSPSFEDDDFMFPKGYKGVE